MKLRLTILGFLLPFFILAIAPLVLWYAKDSVLIDMVVIDKTVPEETYEQHRGLFWVMEHNKIEKENGELYQLSKDYYGYKPVQGKGDQQLPIEDDVDLIYVADTYGVYNTDLYDNYRGNKSQLLYGGLTIFEWNRMMEMKKETTLIIEYNTLAAPTESVVRKIVKKNLDFEWSGWIGKYFSNLDTNEVPLWLINHYEEQTNRQWEFKDEGIVFIDESSQVVILDNDDFNGRVPFQLTTEGKKRYPLAKDSFYDQWFDIIIPGDGYSIQATYTIDFTEKGQRTLRDVNIPVDIPAVIYNEEKQVYYFAGNFAFAQTDYASKWKLPNIAYRVLSFIYPGESFFWNSYVPMMKVILTEIEDSK